MPGVEQASMGAGSTFTRKSDPRNKRKGTSHQPGRFGGPRGPGRPYQRMRADAHVKPEPKLARSACWPGRRRPFSRAS